MSKIVLTGGPTVEQLEMIQSLMKSQYGDPTTHWSFWVCVDGVGVTHPNGGTNRTPRLRTRLTKIPPLMRLTQQHLPLTVEVLEDFVGGKLMIDGVDAGKAGAQLKLQYSFVDHSAEVESARA